VTRAMGATTSDSGTGLAGSVWHSLRAEGTGEFVATATGVSTEVGLSSGMLQEEKGVKTPLTRQLEKLTNQVLWIAASP